MSFKGSRQVFAGVRVHHSNMNLWPLVHAPPRGRDPQQFFDEVTEEAEYAAGVCPIQNIGKRVTKPDSPAY